jgi:hypothetical protein
MLRTATFAALVLAALPALASRPTTREELEELRSELARVESLLAEKSKESVGRAQERLGIVREKLSKFADRLEKEGALAEKPGKPAGEKAALDDKALDQLRSRMAEARYDSLRHQQLETQLAASFVTPAQAVTLLRLYKRPGDRMKALEIIAPRLTDRANVLLVQDAFDRPDEKEKALKLVRAKE